MEKLTQPDIKILEDEIKSRRLSQLVFLGLTAVAIILLTLSQYFHWAFPASLFIGVFGGGIALTVIVNYFLLQKVISDLNTGLKTSEEGVIVKKEMKGGPNSYYTDYPKESLEKLAQYIENKEKGIVTDKESYDSNAARASFLIILDNKSDHSVGVRNYIDFNIGDKVSIELAPRSKTFLSARKIVSKES